MIRALNFAFLAITGLVCLGLYRIAEEARIAAVDLRETRAAIVRENDALVVLGAEWARLTQPERIQALAARHLDLADQPQVQLSSLTLLPPKILPQPGDAMLRDANAVVPDADNGLPVSNAVATPAPVEAAPAPSSSIQSGPPTTAQLPRSTFVALHTGT